MENEWRYSIQSMIDWIDSNIENHPTLRQMSMEIGYSPYYCSNLFHRICGMTLKTYLANRKLSFVAKDLRDTKERILDIAIRYGYSSQEALTRAFVRRFGCTPNSYRKKPIPLEYFIKQQVLFPGHHIEEKGCNMSNIRNANVRYEYLPEHKYIGIWEPRASDYGSFWKYHDCDKITGIVDSMQHVALDVVGCHTAGWFTHDDKKGYFYGFGVAPDYEGPIPEGFEVKLIPASTYLVFFHPSFDFVSENNDAMRNVEALSETFDLDKHESWWIKKGHKWNLDCQTYQRHFPEVFGYEVMRPIK